MMYLQDYQEARQTDLFNKTGSFFAFSTDQFNKAKKEGIKYTDCGHGLICPTEHAKELTDGLGTIYKEAIQQDIQENGKEAIIKRELYNHEAFYIHDIGTTFDALEGYGYTKPDILTVFSDELPNVDF